MNSYVPQLINFAIKALFNELRQQGSAADHQPAGGLVLNGCFLPSANLISGPDAAASAGLKTTRQNGRNNWTLFGTPGQTVNSVDGSGWYLASDGDPAFSGSISQTISGLTAGSTYDVTFYQAAGQFDCYFNSTNTTCTDGNYNQPTTNWWEVTFGGLTQNSQVISKGANDPVSAWQKQVLSFVASGTSATLEFMANGTPGGQPPTALLSAISVDLQGSVTPPPTPPGGGTESAPGPLGIMGAGAAFGFGRRLRRRLQSVQSRK